MSPEFWCGCAFAVWAVVGLIIWLSFCWYEGTSEPEGDGTFSASFLAQAWPLAVVMLTAIAVLWVVIGPFVWIHGKLSEEFARRGRERKKGGIANSGPGRIIEEFGIHNGQVETTERFIDGR